MEAKHRWQEWINMALGLWLFVSPFFGYGHVNSMAAWNSYIFGALVMLMSASAVLFSQIWEEWINMAIGVWLFVSPHVLGYEDKHSVMLNHMNVGAALFGVAIWAACMYPLHSNGDHISHVRKI